MVRALVSDGTVGTPPSQGGGGRFQSDNCKGSLKVKVTQRARERQRERQREREREGD